MPAPGLFCFYRSRQWRYSCAHRSDSDAAAEPDGDVCGPTKGITGTVPTWPFSSDYAAADKHDNVNTSDDSTYPLGLHVMLWRVHPNCADGDKGDATPGVFLTFTHTLSVQSARSFFRFYLGRRR